jgi:ubiquinone/menaquinone biosynthesis C-methylase UbiE
MTSEINATAAADTARVLELSDEEIEKMEPYQFFALLGKRVIHPGGTPSTKKIYDMAQLKEDHEVLEVGCGVGTTAIEIAKRHGCKVRAIDIDPFMVDQAKKNVADIGLAHRVTVEQGDILALRYQDASFDRVVIETVTMFVEHHRAIQEVLRVCRPGGRIVDHEFTWKAEPTEQVRHTMEVELCPSRIASTDQWVNLYRSVGLKEIETATGIPTIMTAWGFLRDEGFMNTARIMSKMFSRKVYKQKISLVMKKLKYAFPYLGWVVLGGTKV